AIYHSPSAGRRRRHAFYSKTCASRHTGIRPGSDRGTLMAAGRNQDPVRVARARVAREGPEIGLFTRVVGIAVHDGAVRAVQDVDLVRYELNGHPSDRSVEPGLDDVGALDPEDAAFECLPGRLPVVDRPGEPGEHLVAQ